MDKFSLFMENYEKSQSEVFELVKSQMLPGAFNGLLRLMELSLNDNYEIVTEPVGEYTKEDEFGSLAETWNSESVWESESGESHRTGTTCVKLLNGKFFKFTFSY